MSREDFLAASADAVDDPPAPAVSSPAPRRRLNGGWVLMVAAGLIAAVANVALLTMGDPSVEVAVLRESAPAGTPVERLAVDLTAAAVDDPRSHLLVDRETLASLTGTVTTAGLDAGVLLRTSDLRAAGGEGPGAMSLPVDPARAAGGLLQPGDRVDVIADGVDGVAGYAARDLLVLEVGQRGGGLAAPTSGHALTVAVEGDQALRLAQAIRSGPIDVVRTAIGGQG